MNRPKTPRRALSLRIREDLVEILEETSGELVVGRNRLVEFALEHYFEDLELPPSKLPPELVELTRGVECAFPNCTCPGDVRVCGPEQRITS